MLSNLASWPETAESSDVLAQLIGAINWRD
jgi:hypothetical protein